MAEGYLRLFARGKAEVYSAGVETHGLNPRAVQVMKEDGVDISNQTSKNVDNYSGLDFDYLITVCDNAKERCPYFSSTAKRFHHDFPDPAKVTGTEEDVMHRFREVRNMIRQYSKEFVEENL